MQEDGSRAMVFLNGSGIQSLYGVTAEEVKRKLLEDALDVPNVDRHAYFQSRLAISTTTFPACAGDRRRSRSLPSPRGT